MSHYNAYTTRPDLLFQLGCAAGLLLEIRLADQNLIAPVGPRDPFSSTPCKILWDHAESIVGRCLVDCWSIELHIKQAA